MSNIPLTEQAIESTNQALQATQRIANDAMHGVSNSVHRGADSLRDNALRVSDNASNYIKHDPIKAVLIAAATGAALMGLVSLMNRPHHRG